MSLRYLFPVLLFAASSAHAQIREKTKAKVSLKGVGFVRAAGHLQARGDHCGIYHSAVDRQAGKLSFAIDCKAEDHRIKTGFIKDKSAIKVVRADVTHRFLRRDIYGYRDCDGNEYHFFDGKSYQLINPGEPIAFYRTYQQQGKHRVTRIFFGTMDGNVAALTFANLEVEFSQEPRFLEKLRTLARNDFELVKYLYLINRTRSF